jgi:hypothetical protein
VKAPTPNQTETRRVIRTLLDLARECRRNRSIPALLGQGWTIAVRGTGNLIEQHGGNRVSFFGMWNRRTTYWTQEDARRALDFYAPHFPHLDLELVHHNEARDRTEKATLDVLRAFIPVRNH